MLAAGKRHYQILAPALSLGYRRGVLRSTWSGREFIQTSDGRRVRKKKLAIVDERGLEADGVAVMDHVQASQAVLEWSQRRVEKAVRTMTVGHVVDAYIRNYEIRSSDETRSHTFTAKRWIGPELRKTLVTDLKTYDLETWQTNLIYFGEMTQGTANRIWTVLRAALNYGHQKMGVSDKDRWTRIKPFSNTNKPKAEYLTAVQARALIRVMPGDFRALALGSLYTGGRYGELSKMLVHHVDIERSQVEFVFTKSGKRRHVPLTEEGAKHFKSLVRGCRPSEIAFKKATGKAWGRAQQMRRMRKASASARFARPVNFHQFRHTYASLLAQNGMTMRSLQELLGHADMRITVQHYAHICPERLADEVMEYLPSFSDDDPPDDSSEALR